MAYGASDCDERSDRGCICQSETGSPAVLVKQTPSPAGYTRRLLFPLPKAIELIAPNVDYPPLSLAVCLPLS